MMKSKFLNALILTALGVPGVAMAADAPPVTGNISLATNYLYRGISQTGGKPAIQGGFDYANPSGFYAGVWGSNISWISDGGLASSASIELDTYLGFKSTFATDFSYDVGFLRYNYPGQYADPLPTGAAKADTNEIYGLIGWKWLTLKYSYALGDTFAVASARGSNYLDLSASYPIADTGITLGAHYGKQTYKAGTSLTSLGYATDAATYSDYKLSASKDFSGFLVGVAYSGTNVKKGAGYGFYTNPQGKDLGKSVVVLSVSHSM